MKITNDSMTVVTYCEDSGQWKSLVAQATLHTNAEKVEVHIMHTPCVLKIERDADEKKKKK